MRYLVILIFFCLISVPAFSQFSATPTTLNFPTTMVSTSSCTMAATVSAAYLTPATGNATVTAPSNFQIYNGSSWVSSYTMAYTGGVIPPTTVGVQFNPTSVTSYSGNVTISASSTINIAVTGTGGTTSSASACASPSALSFGAIAASTTSVPQAFSLSANYLTPGSGNLTIAAPSNYTISSSYGGGYGASMTISYTGGAISGSNIYVQFSAPSTPGTYTGNLSVTGGGMASAFLVPLNGTSLPPCSGTPTAGTAIISSASGYSATPFTLGLTGTTAASGLTYQWESSSSGSSGTFSAISGATNASYSFTGISATTYYHCIVSCSSSSATSTVVSASYSGVPFFTATPATLSFPPTLVSTTSSPISTNLVGTFLVPSSGTFTVRAPSNFAVSPTSGGTYVTSYTVSYSSGGSTSVIYANFTPSAATAYIDSIMVIGGGTTLSIPVNGTGGCGAMTGGTSSATSSYSCGLTTDVISVSGYTSSSAIGLQWQSSPTGSSGWTNITGATNSAYSFPEPTATMFYSCKATCSVGGATATSTVSSIAVNKINGHITFLSTPPDTLDCKVWLIDYSASAGTLFAVDSITTCLDGGMAYYEFNGMASSTYLVKARSLDATSTIVGSSGYVPTYGLSNPHWDTGVIINHIGDYDSMHINMIYGTVPSGPGFIGGLISSGAGKGTTGDVPAVGMMVYLLDATTHAVKTYSYTTSTGAYSFGGIGVGNYIIFPEKMMYTTTPSAVIAITSSAATVNGINFKEHTTAKTITPILPSVIGYHAINKELELFPNPAANELTIKADEAVYSSFTIVNSIGSFVYQGAINSTLSVVNVQSFPAGMYYVTFRGSGGVVVRKFVKE